MITYLKNLEYKDGKLLRNGKICGHLKDGYLIVTINYKNYYVHRIIFLMHHGYLPKEVDHINNDKTDNRIENLRPVTRVENCQNKKIMATNTSGIKNVCWHKIRNKWIVNLKVLGKRKHFGYFEDLELADLVAQEARNKYYGEYACHA